MERNMNILFYQIYCGVSKIIVKIIKTYVRFWQQHKGAEEEQPVYKASGSYGSGSHSLEREEERRSLGALVYLLHVNFKGS